jgi:hypothetical protein
MLRAVSRIVLVVGSVALGAAGALALRADLLVGYRLGRALDAQKAATPFALSARTDRVDRAEVGDEGYWLNRTAFEGQAPFGRHLAVGDRITISGGDGRPRTLEVVEIAPLGAPLLKVAENSTPVRLMRVAARVVSGTEAGREEVVRFYVEVDKPKPLPSSAQAPLGGT